MLDKARSEVRLPAASRDQLLEVTEREFDKLDRIVEGLEEGTATDKDKDDTSIKDIVAHRAHWIDLFLGWYRDGLAGKEVYFPAKGYKWNDLKRYNADLRRTQPQLTWTDARNQLAAAHGRLVRFIEGHSETDLYGGPMAGARNQWTPGRWAEAAGPSHYRSATKYIRARLRELDTSRP